MTKYIGLALLLVGTAGIASAVPLPTPEIDPGSGISAFALLSGALLVLRAVKPLAGSARRWYPQYPRKVFTQAT